MVTQYSNIKFCVWNVNKAVLCEDISSIELDFMCLLTLGMYFKICLCLYPVYDGALCYYFYYFIITQVNKGTVNIKEGFLN
jgi:hypothetical protein